MELSVNEVIKSYGNVTAVNQLSFHVKQGEIFALLGPNGAGKSSLVRMLTGFTKPDSGQISLKLDGQFFSHIPAHALGYLPEDRGLYPEKSVLKNLVYFARLHGLTKAIAEQEALGWLDKFDLSDRADEQLKSLSKGNQQKVQLISAVIHRPKWVILDEPFSGLDPVNQEKVVDFLTQLKAQGMTVILSAHQMAMVEKLADRMLLMNLGEAVFYGNLADIRAQAQSNKVLTLTYRAIDQAGLLTAQQTWQLAPFEDNKLQVYLQPEQSINQALEMLAQVGEITAVQSQSLDLHQLYLKAISQHKTQYQQAAQERQYA
ncbi:ATP-binding cassette domain-containing protein [Thalassotalea sp. LPB0316]|uniref:ABC transporter ATP-binding protein n=1 Tax=Thalassotalea sp. LPB0316 TaxID=2769490 RepID=UPI001865E4DD|nr:ATP-binding cassette domain-containing protein [Thalassotalea sp. LPB0316]QOL25942.1 ATP-binding cassette domain-containing protein [Thalassotalea sp. LPB0316]